MRSSISMDSSPPVTMNGRRHRAKRLSQEGSQANTEDASSSSMRWW
ncbi:MAG: hypothetical protein ABSH47_10095 [Bryobacteraceae bacterium]